MSVDSSQDRVVDKNYLESLEKKLSNLKDPKKATAKQFISDIASQKDHQLFRLLAAPSPPLGFEDDFVVDCAITPNYLQRKIAPQTCAVNKQELVHLVKSDIVQKLYEELEALTTEDGEPSFTPVITDLIPRINPKEKED